MVWRNSSKKW